MSLPEIMARGNYRESLEELRDHLARRIVEAEDKDASSLARQLTDVLARIDGLPETGKGSRIDELAGRRADRLSDAANS